jgi:hypothetical protein
VKCVLQETCMGKASVLEFPPEGRAIKRWSTEFQVFVITNVGPVLRFHGISSSMRIQCLSHSALEQLAGSALRLVTPRAMQARHEPALRASWSEHQRCSARLGDETEYAREVLSERPALRLVADSRSVISAGLMLLYYRSYPRIALHFAEVLLVCSDQRGRISRERGPLRTSTGAMRRSSAGGDAVRCAGLRMGIAALRQWPSRRRR